MSEPTQDTKRVHVFVSGRVQGVYYRASTRDKARELDVGGWVRNRSDGRVEAVFEGAPEAIDTMVDWCKTGSRAANVEAVEVATEQPEGRETFDIRR
jgi:acylphosphatase